MAIDPSRLYITLLNTGLQQKDNPTYQVIHDLIDNLVSLNSKISSLISSASGSSSIVNNITNVLSSSTEDNIKDGDESQIIIPSPLLFSGTTGSVLFMGPSGIVAQDNADFFWDNTNKRLGLGTLSPSSQVTIAGTISYSSGNAVGMQFNNTISGGTANTWELFIGGAAVLNPRASGSAAFISNSGSFTINKNSSGTHADFATVLLNPPTIGANAGSALTNASTLKISAAPTGATNNYAFYVDGNVVLSGATGLTGIGILVPNYTLQIKGATWRMAIGDASVNGGAGLLLLGGSTQSNWQLGGSINGDFFEITPSTATGGSIFTTPVFTTSAAGILTLSGYGAGFAKFNSSGVLSSVNTVANVVASTFEKAETGTDANVLTYTTGGADEYLNVMVSTDVSALTGTSVAVTVTWKDSNNSTATSTITLSGVGDGTINVPINAKTSTNVVVSTVFVGVSTAYNISAFIVRLK